MHSSSWRAQADGASIDGEEIGLAEVDADGRLVALAYYDVADRGAANHELWKRYRRSAEGRMLPRAAFDAVDAINHRDIVGFRAALADDFMFVDHRPLGLESMGTAEYVEFVEVLIAETSDFVYESVRPLEMSSVGGVDVNRLVGHTVDGAAFELVYLRVAAATSGGLAALELFPLEEESAALARFAQLEQQLQPRVGFDDLEAFRSMLAEDCVLVDHRLLAAEPMGRDEYVAYFAALLEQTSDLDYERFEVLAESPEGMVERARLTGHTTDGVEFETLFLRVTMLRDGLFVVMEIFAPEARDAALARFHELCANSAIAPPRNKATEALERAQQLYAARDWDALKAMASPNFLFSDRRPLAHVTSDRDGWIHSSKLMASASAEEDRTILSVLGDRLALYKSLWTAQVEAAPFAVESLGLCEVDDEGHFVELLHFDLEQRGEADDELTERFQRIQDGESHPSNAATHAMARWIAALEDRDRDAMIAGVADRFVYDDRRLLTGVSLDRAEWISTQDISIATNLHLHSKTLSTLGDRLALAQERWHGESEGTVFDGENLTIREVDTEGRITAIVTFDVDDRVAANEELLARYAKLSDPQ